MLQSEAIAGVMGLGPVLSGKLPKPTKILVSRGDQLVRDMAAAATEFAKLRKPAPFPETTVPRKRFQEIVDQLNQEPSLEELEQTALDYEDDLGLLVETQIIDNRYYLQSQVPTQVPFGAFSMTLLEPSDSDKARFMWQCNLIDRPLRFAELFLAGALTTVETALMRTLYPELFDVLLLSVIEEVIKAAENNDIASWEGGWKRLAMSNLLGVQVESFQNVLAWQTGFEEKTAGRPPNPGRIELAEANQTDLQKTQAR
jgi:hypothetical protein